MSSNRNARGVNALKSVYNILKHNVKRLFAKDITVNALNNKRSELIEKITNDIIVEGEADEEIVKKRLFLVGTIGALLKNHKNNRRLAWLVSIESVILIVFAYFLFPVHETLISVDLKVSAVGLKMAPSRNDRVILDMNIGSASASPFFFESAKISGDVPIDLFDSVHAYTFNAVKQINPEDDPVLAQIDLPERSELFLVSQENKDLNLYLLNDSASSKPAIVKWKIEATELLIGQDNKKMFPLKSDHPDSKLELNFEKTLLPGTYIVPTISDVRPWKLGSRLFASHINLKRPSVRSNDSTSAIITGTIKLLETNDPPVRLYERDILEMKFSDQAEVFVSGGGDSLKVHFEGMVSELIYGPQVIAHESKMPSKLKTLDDQAPYILAALAILVPVIQSIFKRNG